MKSRPQGQSAHLEPWVIQDPSTLQCVLSNSLNGCSKDNSIKCSVFTLINFHGIWTSARRLCSSSLGTEYILTIAGIKSFPFPPQCSNLPRSDIQSLQTFIKTHLGKHSTSIPSYHGWCTVYLQRELRKYCFIHQSVLKRDHQRVGRRERENDASLGTGIPRFIENLWNL